MNKVQMVGKQAIQSQKIIGGKNLVVDLNTKIDLKAEEKNNKFVFTTGKNCKDRTVKRGYLNSDEANNFMNIFACVQLVEGVRNLNYKSSPCMWSVWKERGMITPEQQKNLKLFATYGAKFINDVFNNNLDSMSKETFSGKSLNYDYRLIDDYTVQKMYSLFDNKKDFSIAQDDFFDLVEAKMQISCKGCTKDRVSCDVCKLFNDKFVPPVPRQGEEKFNCEYAY